MTRNTFIDGSFFALKNVECVWRIERFGWKCSKLSVGDLGLEVCCSVLFVLVFCMTKGFQTYFPVYWQTPSHTGFFPEEQPPTWTTNWSSFWQIWTIFFLISHSPKNKHRSILMVLSPLPFREGLFWKVLLKLVCLGCLGPWRPKIHCKKFKGWIVGTSSSL